MKKKIGIVVGIMVMVLVGVMGAMPVENVEAANAWDAAADGCQKAGGTYNVKQVYSATSWSGYCDMSRAEADKLPDTDTTHKWTNETDAYNSCPCGYTITGSIAQDANYKCNECSNNDNVYNILNGNTDQNPANGGHGSDSKDTSGSGYGTSSGSGGNGASNNSGTGLIGNDDNSDAKKKDDCGDGQVDTFLFGECAGGADGEGVFMVLNVILQVFTWGVGIAGTLGIVLVGIQYMTSKDDPAQMTKAKSRMIQIVIGLVAYAVLWAFLQWLLPGGVLGN